MAEFKLHLEMNRKTKPTLIRLSSKDQRSFVAAILNPPPLRPAMQRAWEAHARLIAK
jgi:uncharacterized protein (DUF1778 family)